ncbi:hypothetical protein PC129_g18885 [Phytophthora cactorum]|uniref:Uncharacterized protein n=1 Tax=Phytophthora cactorum TaxID=29920 RepID=A0A8T1HDT0_9STRA|nr:hypothetical protein PC118_g19785 [Phytophthora cactorum]KAG3210116.1 hypothetical protein PC129_g18885 [Phytophthora cactorum]
MRGPLSEEDLAKVDRNNATDTMDNLRAEDEKPLFAAVASSFVQAANGISKSVAERASDNTAGLYLPPVLPHQLVKTNVLSFQQMIQSHAPRILVRQSNVEVPQIGQELSQLRRAYAREVLRGALDSLDLASTFPNTATVESDFFIMGWEKYVYRKSTTDFSLEGVMHAKQFKALRQLADKMKA